MWLASFSSPSPRPPRRVRRRGWAGARGGGPLGAGDVACFVLVPIAPHSLVSRPLVLGGDQVVELRIKERNALISLDGGDPEQIPVGEHLLVGLSHETVRIGRTDEWTWWRAVRRTFL